MAAIDVAAMEPLLRLSAGVAGRTARADAAAAARSWHEALTQRYMPLPRVAVVQVVPWCRPPAAARLRAACGPARPRAGSECTRLKAGPGWASPHAGFRVLGCANDRDQGPALLESAWGRCMTQHTAWHTKKTGWASAPRRVWRRPEHRPLRIQQRWARFSLWIFDDLAARLMHGGQSVADPPSYTFSASSFGVC